MHVFIICGCVCVLTEAGTNLCFSLVACGPAAFLRMLLFPICMPRPGPLDYAPPCVRGGRPWRARPHHHIFHSVLGHMPVISNTLVLIVGWIFV